MLILVRYEKGKLIYTHCHVITSHKLGRCVVQTATALFKQQWRCSNKNGVIAYEESLHNKMFVSVRGGYVILIRGILAGIRAVPPLAVEILNQRIHIMSQKT